MAVRPLFSVTHTTARPELWHKSYSAWIAGACHAGNVEYVLCADERWGFVRPNIAEGNALRSWERERTGPDRTPLNRLVWNTGRRCLVDGANIAASASTGQIIIVNSDDIFPPENWDALLFRALFDAGIDPASGEFVIHVSSGTPADAHGLMVLQILSRARYERLGYALYPEYQSMFADNDFGDMARRDGVVVDASGLTFYHDHPAYNGTARSSADWDEVYRHENEREAYRVGEAIFQRRKLWGFKSVPDAGLSVPELPAAPAPTIALCLTGENFRGEWVDHLLPLYHHLQVVRGFNVIPLRGYTTNVYVTRLEMWAALRSLEVAPDLALWIDDDNLVLPEQFDTLLGDLEADPELATVAGWCWVHDRDGKHYTVSAGHWAPDGAHWRPFDSETFPQLAEVQPAEVSGFPCVLMRGSVVPSLEERPFIDGILDTLLPYGIGGEDLAFCRALGKAGLRLEVDPRVRVRHLKFMEVVPEFEARPKHEPKIATMMRVKNEARWIGRAVESVRELGPVVVLDDGSTDDTGLIASTAGAVVIPSPFVGLELDERRDKNFLLERTKDLCHPDWIFCIDGDEELCGGDVGKIRRACASNQAEVFLVRILYLWDSPNKARFDGRYGKFGRCSLFRVLEGMEFQSLYATDGKDGRPNVNLGLHTGNAPLYAGGRYLRSGVLGGVILLHYGYMEKADRLRKYAYYNELDPNNDFEDGYRHLVQGDVAEVPATAKLKHGGPLDVRELPASVAPVGWEKMGAAV